MSLRGFFFGFLHYVNIFNFPRHVSVSPTAFLGSDCLLLQYGVEWQQCLLIGWCVEPHLFHFTQHLGKKNIWRNAEGESWDSKDELERGKKERMKRKNRGQWRNRHARQQKTKTEGGYFRKYWRWDEPKRQFWRGTPIFLFQFFFFSHPPPSPLPLVPTQSTVCSPTVRAN